MNLITITKNQINDKLIQTVSARELHTFLGVETKFNDWFRRMCEYGFVDNTDYLLVTQKRATNNPKNPTTDFTDYAITLSMAKELAMIQRTDKGKEARLYFIACEQQLQDLRNDLQLKEKARADARIEYRPMTDAILAIRGADTKPYHYSNEANLVYLVVMGATCKKLKEHLELDNLDNLRDALTPLQIAAVQDIQKHNTTLLEIEMGYDERKIKLNKLFYRKWAVKLLEEHIRLEA